MIFAGGIASSAAALHAEKVRKSFGVRGNIQQVLRGIDLRIAHGEFVGIMGPSGSGKSTLLNVLAAIDRATEGRIRIGDTDITAMGNSRLAEFRRQRLGLIFQDYNLLDMLTVKENVLLPVSLGRMPKAEAEERFRRIAEELELLDLAARYPSELSGGQRQRTSAARALIREPSIVFADEPTGALDSKSASSLLGLMERLNRVQGVTFLMATHDPAVSSYCSRVVFLRDGAIYSEVYKGERSRQAFFKEILNVQAVLGGDHVDTL